ncbi:adenylyl-sulfate kinase [Nonomuraea sp. LPB2021202275-12-8]|uniref:adenylyl-sulfate kinase n=1 Tax=Nonomuraea sp. LPB2021202275-12-8 TaxID=3120159 RepID=UPI00300CCBFC
MSGRAALLITGTVGAGKTSTADAVGDLLADAGIPHAVLDLDWLRRSWPCPPGDPFNSAMTLRNLRDVARNFLDGGAARLVLAGVIESRDERRLHEEAVGVELAVCRLRVAPAALHRRLVRRHDGDDAGLRWHLERSGELDRVLDAARVADTVVDAGDRDPAEVAAAVLAAAGWR